MLESYIRTGDGKDYVDVDCVREALGIKEDEDISLAIKKLKEERERYKSNCDYFAGIAEDKLCDRNKLELELREALGTVCEYVGEYAEIPGLVRKLKKERDKLKERCGKLEDRLRTYRFIANGTYGDSCGYSKYTCDKAPAFRCDVISYSWNFGSIAPCSLMDEPSYPIRNGSIRVELDLTPNANYKGAFDIEGLKRYIQAYGSEKKLGIIESVDYQNAKVARAELAHLYKTVLGKEKLDVDLSPHEIMKAILDEYKRGRDSLAELRAKIREIYREVFGFGWEENQSYVLSLNDINEEYKRVVHNFKERTADWSKAQQELDRYRLAVGSLLDIPKESRDDLNAIEFSFTFSKEVYKSLQKFRDDVCKILDTPSSMDDKYILEQVEKLKDNKPTVFRNDVAVAIGMTPKDSNPDIIKRVMAIRESHDKLCKDYTELRNAIWEAMDRKPETLPGDDARLVWEVQALAYGNKWLREFRNGVAEAIGITYHTTNTFLMTRVSDIYKERGEAHDLAMELDRKCIDLTAKNAELESKWNEQYRLRQMWHVRWESENERANGEHKRAEKLRSDVTALKKKVEFLEESSNTQWNELVALQAFKNEFRKLKEEKTKVISALGQDIWDDCVK